MTKCNTFSVVIKQAQQAVTQNDS